jgi:hypothetical protein
MVALEDAIAQNEALVLDRACTYLDKYYLYFMKGLDWLEQTRSQIVEYQFVVSEVLQHTHTHAHTHTHTHRHRERETAQVHVLVCSIH